MTGGTFNKPNLKLKGIQRPFQECLVNLKWLSCFRLIRALKFWLDEYTVFNVARLGFSEATYSIQNLSFLGHKVLIYNLETTVLMETDQSLE